MRYRLTFRRRRRRGTTSRRLRKVSGTHPAATGTPPRLERRDPLVRPSGERSPAPPPTLATDSATPSTRTRPRPGPAQPLRLARGRKDAESFLAETPALQARFRALDLAPGGERVAFVQERATGRTHALKLLRTSATTDWDDWARLEAEAKTLRSLRHRGIPRWREHGETEGGAYLLMDRAAGLSLQARLDRGDRWSDAKLLRVLQRLLEVVTYLQELNPPVFHCALRPEHVVVSDRGEVSLTSFGEARSLITSTTAFVGDGAYFPAGARPGPAADLYGVGATIAAIASGTDAASLPRRAGGIDLSACMRPCLVRDALELALGQGGQGVTAAELGRRIHAHHDARRG